MFQLEITRNDDGLIKEDSLNEMATTSEILASAQLQTGTEHNNFLVCRLEHP